ncbi:MAG: ATP-binding protein [Deltaproteobacteria bacterium]|jgi:two-component system NtrC family sensor kinase|nr:ATP-binding protein [Deltaproteobacteria bacterium]
MKKHLEKFKPAFWDHKDIAGGHTLSRFSFQRKWKLIVVFTSLIAILPLFIMNFVDYSLTRRIIEKELKYCVSETLDSAITLISFCNDVEKFAFEFVGEFNSGEKKDLFLVDLKGSLLTSSFYYDKIGSFNIDLSKGQVGIIDQRTYEDKQIITGHSRIPGSDMILVLVRSKQKLSQTWLKPRIDLVWFFVLSIILILISIMGMATFLIDRIHKADRERIKAIHQVEYTNKLTSIGRLASGVAHEINNPLAIMNQKIGLIIDILGMSEDFASKKRLVSLTNSVMATIERCGNITKRLLDFATHTDSIVAPVDINQIMTQVLDFLGQEAKRRNILISFDNSEPVENFECDIGNLQQIFLNMFNNAFSAMKNGGLLEVKIKSYQKEKVNIWIADNGVGIAKDDINKIFEPFFSTADEPWGTGLGLSITYGLIKEMGGDITVKSTVGKGTSFKITLPFKS